MEGDLKLTIDSFSFSFLPSLFLSIPPSSHLSLIDQSPSAMLSDRSAELAIALTTTLSVSPILSSTPSFLQSELILPSHPSSRFPTYRTPQTWPRTSSLPSMYLRRRSYPSLVDKSCRRRRRSSVLATSGEGRGARESNIRARRDAQAGCRSRGTRDAGWEWESIIEWNRERAAAAVDARSSSSAGVASPSTAEPASLHFRSSGLEYETDELELCTSSSAFVVPKSLPTATRTSLFPFVVLQPPSIAYELPSFLLSSTSATTTVPLSNILHHSSTFPSYQSNDDDDHLPYLELRVGSSPNLLISTTSHASSLLAVSFISPHWRNQIQQPIHLRYFPSNSSSSSSRSALLFLSPTTSSSSSLLLRFPNPDPKPLIAKQPNSSTVVVISKTLHARRNLATINSTIQWSNHRN